MSDINDQSIPYEAETEEDLFDDYEPDFSDDDLEQTFDPGSQVIIRYGTEEFAAPVDGTKTLLEIVQEYRGSIGVSDVSRLNFKIETTYVAKTYIPKPGEVVVASANADTKG